MSRDIPMDKALSWDDRVYLDARGSWGVNTIDRIDANYPPSDADVEKWANRNAVGVGPLTGDTALINENEALRQALRDAGIPLPGEQDADADEDVDEDAEVPPYEDWTLPDLQAEAGKRKLVKSGTKADLVHRLEEDDIEKA